MFQMHLFYLLLWSFNGFASADLSSSTLQSLSSTKHPLKLSELAKENGIAILFQPDCSYCTRQIEDLACLAKEQSVVLLGAFANESELKRAYTKLNSLSSRKFPGYLVKKTDLAKWKLDAPLTPQVLLLKENGSTKVLRGYHECPELKKEISDFQKTTEQTT